MGSDPSYGDMEAHLVACIHESLSLYLYDNAQFLCERLVAAYESQVSILLDFLQILAPYLILLSNVHCPILQLCFLWFSPKDASHYKVLVTILLCRRTATC